VQYLGELGADVRVFRNDAITVDEVAALKPSHIVLSPGPCTPNEAGICLDLIERLGKPGLFPILGVCLGHQSIGQAFGGKVVRATPQHGKVFEIKHSGAGVFRGINGPLKATRYHSLVVERAGMPRALAVNAETSDGLCMGLMHESLPVHGVQFHPESIASEHGHLILKNFLDIAAQWNAATGRFAAPRRTAQAH
jgi:anthranilate synthase component 2